MICAAPVRPIHSPFGDPGLLHVEEVGMMKGLPRSHPFVWLMMVGLIVPSAVCTEASDEGEVAAALVSESSYRHYLDDMLYTHYGDDRWLGPEHDLARSWARACL